MYKMKNIATISALTLMLAACGDNTPTAAESPTLPPVNTADSVAPVEAPAPIVEPTQQNLPGVYAGRLPCGDCAAVVTRLELLADGSYKVNEVFDGKSDSAALDSDGKWIFDSLTRRVTLDPTAQDWQNRTFEALNTGALRPLDANGAPYSASDVNDLKVVP